jgi:hypothetical protein
VRHFRHFPQRTRGLFPPETVMSGTLYSTAEMQRGAAGYTSKVNVCRGVAGHSNVAEIDREISKRWFNEDVSANDCNP